MIVCYRAAKADRVVFLYAFAKNAGSTLSPKGCEALMKVAETFLTISDGQVAALLDAGEINEVKCDDDEQA